MKDVFLEIEYLNYFFESGRGERWRNDGSLAFPTAFGRQKQIGSRIVIAERKSKQLMATKYKDVVSETYSFSRSFKNQLDLLLV